MRAVLIVAALSVSPALAQGFAPIPSRSGPDAPPESPDYPAPPMPAPPSGPAVPMSTPMISYPRSPGATPQKPPPPMPPGPIMVAPPAPRPSPSQPGLIQAGMAPAPQPPAAPPAPDPWLPRGAAELRALDKINARSLTLSGRVGQAVRYATLTIVVRACVVRPPDQAADAAAFLDITDSRPNTPAFHGWMLAGEPGLMVYEHPVYDVRLLGCRA